MRVEASAGCCTVIVTVDADAELVPELEAHARDGLRRFAEMPGFIAGALHRSDDGGRLVQYLQWASEADHLACMRDPRWDELPSTRRFMEVAASGASTVDVRVYDVVADSSA